MAIPNSRDSARQLVEQIATDHGYLEMEDLRTIEPGLRRRIEVAFLKKDLMIGSSVIALAKNLYTSKARFVFELLQNCDDNSYTKVFAGVEPSVSFSVHPHQIVLECNEDGFNHDNLVAICSVGQSSKTGAQGYIGEKGIGFKSVFMAAWKVHIQSRSFSFSFTHRDGESGMGMISPIWETFDNELDPSLTRITLHLHDSGDSGILERTRQSIQEQFEELQETILLFMKNLRKVNVGFYDDNGQQVSSTEYSVRRPQPNFAVLKRRKAANGTTEERVKRFHVTTHQATNLAKNENRTYSEREEARRAYSTSQVVLAFPLTKEFVPIIEPQDLFVFLPVRPVGFSFLIQADFVTDSSRQDIVKDSLRNNGLIGHVAQAFVKAVLQFCDHSTLRYHWMRYLPDQNCPNWNSLWLSLINNIADCLAAAPVLFGRPAPMFSKQRGTGLRLIRDLVYLGSNCVDEDGQPLFDDGNPGQVVSQHYTRHDIKILKSYGLKMAVFSHILAWLTADLQRGEQSRMKSPETSEGWHTCAVKLLRRPFEEKWTAYMSQLKEMDLLPLENGTWVSTGAGPVYFREVDGLTIPLDVGLRLISTKVKSTTRKSLFCNLGAQTASVQLVRTQILQRYSSEGDGACKSLEASKRHLEFLYLTEHLKGDREPSYSQVAIYSSWCNLFRPHGSCVYNANKEPYGAWELFRKTDPGPNPGNGAPGYDVVFANERYFMDSPSPPTGHQLSWLQWFYDTLHIRDHVMFDLNSLDKHAEYLQKHRPEKFLGALRERYKHAPRSVTQDFINTIRETEVLCRGNRRVKLKEAYFPTKELERRVKQFIGENTDFPWLWLDNEASRDAIPSGWKRFLGKLRAGTPLSDVEFGLDMLRCSQKAFLDTKAYSSQVKLVHLYEHIEAKHRENGSNPSKQDLIRKMFSDNKWIYIPPNENGCYCWYQPSDCVWNAAQDLQTKFVLQLCYEPYLRDEDCDSAVLKRFFKTTLGIQDCTYDLYMKELDRFKEDEYDDSDEVTGIYKALKDLLPSLGADEKKSLRNGFESEARIFILSDGRRDWRKVSQCVWSDAARLRGLVSLNDHYKDLEPFFVDCLGVKRVNLEMAIDELKEAGSAAGTSIPVLKASIWTVNSLFPTARSPPAPADITRHRIFPIRCPDGSSACVSIATDFFVGDRDRLRQSFEGKVKFLDFGLEDCARLRPFMRWMGLETRFLSRCVTEVTSFHGDRARPTMNPERQIRNRAHALLRVAATFNSPRTRTTRGVESLYDVLRNAEIMETDGISSDLQLSQDRTTHVAEGEKTSLHIDDNNENLKIYVPRKRDEQEYMFSKVLGERLFKWMMSDPAGQAVGAISGDGIGATKDVLVTPRSQLARALDDNGIAPVSVANLDEVVSSEPELLLTPSTIAAEQDFGFDDSPAGDQDDNKVGVFDTPLSSVDSPDWSSHRTVATGSGLFTPPRPPLVSRSPYDPSAPMVQPIDTMYTALLGVVISAARNRILPVHGTMGMEDLSASLATAADGLSFTVRGTTPFERDCKIGAAGELFVFELLSHLHNGQPLPGLSRENWQSTMRRYAIMHPEYADMEPWTGSETSDITYDDCSGILTEMFIDQGYLARDEWAGKKPFYFIEVKTTTMSCNTPFFMGKNQYRLMRNCMITPGDHDTIYTVFRVYNLGRGGMGLKIYLDPETLRLNEDLEFSSEGPWSVIPVSGA